MFRLMDANGSGEINEREFLQLARVLSPEADPALAWGDMLAKVDKDENKKINEKEFCKYYLDHVYEGLDRLEVLKSKPRALAPPVTTS